MNKKKLARYPLGNPKRLWKQEQFVLTVANPGVLSGAILRGKREETEKDLEITRRGVRTCHHGGFTHYGTVWSTDRMLETIISESESIGAKVLVCNFSRFGGMGEDYVFCRKSDIIGYMRQKSQWKCIMGYLMWDEPTTMAQMEETRRMIDIAEKERPDLCATTVANPSYQKSLGWMDEKYVSYINNFMDIIEPPYMNFDYYPFGRRETACETDQLDKSYMWLDLEVVRRASQSHDTPLFFCYQGQNLHNVETFLFSMTRLCANAGILYGAKGLSHYTPLGNFMDRETGGAGEFFEQQRQMNMEIKELSGTLMALECKRVIHDETLLAGDNNMDRYRTSIEESELLCGSLPPRVSISEHEDLYGNSYLMVLNRDYLNAVDMHLTWKKKSHVYQVSRLDGDQHLLGESTDQIAIHLDAGDLALLRIQDAEEEPCVIEYYLEK